MAIQKNKLFPFTKAMIDAQAKEIPALYFLANAKDEILLFKAAQKLKSELEAQLAGEMGKSATQFGVTLCSDPMAELKKALDEFQAAEGRLPEFNQASS